MPGNDQEISTLLEKARDALKAIHDTAEASPEARAAAKQSYKDVLRLIARHAIATYEGRTAALTGLIVELKEVTDNIQVENPIAARMTEITGIADRALELFREEKKAAD